MRLFLSALLFLACGNVRAAPVTALAFSPDGKVLASTAGSTLTLHDPSSGNATATFPCENARLTSLSFAPDGALLAVGGGTPGEKGELRLINVSAKKWLGTQPLGSDLITSIAFSPDGHSLAAASMEKIVRVFQVADEGARLTETITLKGHSGPVTSAVFSPDGKTIITASLDRSLKVWSATDGSLLRSLGQHTDAVHCLALRPAAPDRPDAPLYCATGSEDRSVRVWQPTIGRMVRIVRGHSGSVLALAYTPDGRSLFSAGQEGIIRQIDADSDAVQREWRASSEWIHCLAVSPDGRTLASGDWQGKVTLNTASGEK